MSATGNIPTDRRGVIERAADSVLAPARAFRLAYLPLLMVYFASGALGIIAVADSFWVKKSLTLTPADLASLAVWLQLPWSIKMVVSEVVDCVAIMGSRRRVYILLGAGLIASGLLLLAAAASGAVTAIPPERAYVIAQLLVVAGGIIQEVVADALSAEVVARVRPDGAPRSPADVDSDLAMVQVLSRLTYSIGAFLVGFLAGRLAESLPYHVVFLIGLAVPAISILGALVVSLPNVLAAAHARRIDWRILGGGLAFAVIAVALGLSEMPFGQEALFLIALGVILAMARLAMAELDPAIARRIAAAAAMIFAFRAAPTLGDGYRWFLIDRHGFDERFFGVLQVTGTGIGLGAMWLLTDTVMRRTVTVVLLALTIVAAILWLPSLLLVSGGHRWTYDMFGLGPRGIALFD
ncbi:MAG TPA: hypothetical protein PK264_17140, partial [Hyphomicrobiaceae bacterium]|nr:hypothetical protein [Hyphomicrobiaceae bacterium]